VLKAITLFAKKYEPEFGKYAGRFAPLVWQLATSLGEETRYDGVVYASITFLQTLARLGSLKDMFNDESRMRALCERVIIPQLKLRESDEECFESDPIEYIRRDLEASDRETRRRGTVEFVEGLMEHFEQQITNLLKQYVGRMLQDYRAEPDAKWQLKDAAMYAVLALSAKSIGRDGAAKEVNRYINVVDFVQHEVLPELQKDLDRVPVLHADAIKFVCVFRSLLPPPAIPVILPLLVRHLESDLVVVHTYAAHAIERLLFRDSKTEPRVPREMLRPHLARLLQLLFACLNKPDSAENEYVVRAIMRVCGAAQEDMVPLLRPVVGSLTGIVKRVALRSTNPNFNYMLFETLAVLVRSLGAAHPDSLATFESALFPTFSEILQSGNQDLMPYVLQMLALLLSRHASVPDHYRGLFDLAISPPMYENHGNIPAIVTLLRAFLAKGEKAAAFIKERLTGALGAFQKILSVRRQVSQAVELIVAMLHYLPLPLYRDHLPEVCRLFFVRLSGDKSPYTFRQIVSFFSHFVLKHGFNALVQVCERIGPNVLPDFMGRMWLPRINNVVGYDARCLAAVALVNACTQSSAMAEGPFQPLWPRALEAAVVLLEKKEEDDGDNTEAELQDRAETGGSTGFAKLPSAALPQPDPLAEVRDPRAFIGAAVGRFLETRPQMAAAMQTLSDEAQKALMGFGAGGGGAVAGVQ
jgi:exportin-2 (importin alpha re-exporter)